MSKITEFLVADHNEAIIDKAGGGGLERSCGPSAGDWIRHAPAQPGLDRIEAFFSGHAYDLHRHDCYAIGYTLAGVQSFHYRGGETASAAGHAMVIHPDEKHDGRSGIAGGFVYRMLYLEPRLISAALGGGLSLPFVGTAVTLQPQLLRALRPALGDLSRPLEPLETDEAILTVAEALRALDRSAPAARPSPVAAAAVERARDFLDVHWRQSVSSIALEQITGFDRFALARHFRAHLGTSPYRYLAMRRLDRARAAIRAGHPLADVAALSGFADQSHMTRQFKRAFGLAPGWWRTLQRSA